MKSSGTAARRMDYHYPQSTNIRRLTIARYRYLKHIDRFNNNYVFCFITGGSVKFLLLHNPDTHHNPAARTSTAASARSPAYGQPPSSTYNPSAPAVEETIKNFFVEVYDVWLKTIMNPFYRQDMKVSSPVFRARVAQAARKHL